MNFHKSSAFEFMRSPSEPVSILQSPKIRPNRFLQFYHALYFGVFIVLWVQAASAASPELKLNSRDGGLELRVIDEAQGSKDWKFQTSKDLTLWDNASTLGSIMSEKEGQAPIKRVPLPDTDVRFFRVTRSEGLYDNGVFHTIRLTFPQASWQSALTTARTTSGNVAGSVELDNGVVITNIGARYKGNTSFSMGGTKKSINLEFDYLNPGGDLLGYSSLNLNNAAGDETIMREAVYFSVMQAYAVCPKGSMARLFINGQDWGVYSLAQNGDGDLVKEWFKSNSGDRWRAPNAGGFPIGAVPEENPDQTSETTGLSTSRVPPGGGPGGGGGFASPLSALSWQGTNINVYKSYYELKVQNSTNAWEILYNAIDVLNNSPLTTLREKAEDVLAVDRWLWFTVVENIFADDDSYWNKGADYAFYHEPETGRIHPIEHDGNEAFTAGDVSLSPVIGSTGTNRPILSRFLAIPELRQRYLAHMRTVLNESFHPDKLTPLINHFHRMSIEAIVADPKKSYNMAGYTNDLNALKSFVTNRYKFLTNHVELTPLQPSILDVSKPTDPVAGNPVPVTARISPAKGEGIDSVWLYYRVGGEGKFGRIQMTEVLQQGEGDSSGLLFAAQIPASRADTGVYYYVEARASNSAKAAAFFPTRAEEAPLKYRPLPGFSITTDILINELVARNDSGIRDPQAQREDWIELHNVTAKEVNLSGKYLTTSLNSPRKWQFPNNTSIPAFGYLLIWADDDESDTPGLHTNFNLDADGETLYLIDSDNSFNQILDSLTYSSLAPDQAIGRVSGNPSQLQKMNPTPGTANP